MPDSDDFSQASCEDYFVFEEKPDHAYRTEIPNIIFEMGLTPNEMFVYLFLKRVAGDTGRCFLSKAQLKEELPMKYDTYLACRRRLSEDFEQLGCPLIKVFRTKNSKGGSGRNVIKIIDIWHANGTHFRSKKHLNNAKNQIDSLQNPQAASPKKDCVEKPNTPLEEPSEFKKSLRSPSSGTGGGPPNGTPKEEPLRKNNSDGEIRRGCARDPGEPLPDDSPPLFESNPEPPDGGVQSALEDAGLDAEDAEQIASKYPAEVVLSALEALKQRSEIQNPAAWMHYACKKNIHRRPTEAEKVLENRNWFAARGGEDGRKFTGGWQCQVYADKAGWALGSHSHLFRFDDPDFKKNVAAFTKKLEKGVNV